MSPHSNSPLADKIAEAKRRLPLPLLMERRGLAEHAKQSAFCPLHSNIRTKAFSIFQDEGGQWRWKCHSQCGSGDEITLLEKFDGLTTKDATRQYLIAAGVEGRSGPSLRASDSFTPSPRIPAPPRPLPTFPAMARGSANDLAQLSELRRVDVVALKIESDVGVLHFATLHGHRAWIITDDERLNAQARRLDGKSWEHIGAKAWTLPGSWAAHPIGMKIAASYPCILLVEGGPDLLAAAHFIEATRNMVTWCPVAMLGAAQRIPKDAVKIFAGKRVRIYPHSDDAGMEAARQWAQQIADAGAAKVDAFSFAGLRKANGELVNDLNDCTTIHADDAAQMEDLLP